MSIKHDHTLNPVTALAFYGRANGPLLLLAGEGSFLKVFEAETSKIVLQCQIFEEQDIHGIAISESADQADDLKIVIWGGKCVVLFSKAQFDTALSQGVTSIVESTVQVSDWILDVAISLDERTSCVLVTAHNTVLRAKLLQNGKPLLLEELPSPSKSILYSAHIIWDTAKRILIAAGTVFGEIIVWQCSISQDGQFSDSHVLFTFTGHEGSIFGVNISPRITGLGSADGRLLASCSDDRTIRVWDLSESSRNTKFENGNILPRETGFGENQNEGDSQTSNERCLATVMGHASRIWRVRVLVEDSGFPEYPSINILSFGEDTTTQQWALNFTLESDSLEPERDSKKSSAPKATLTHTNTFAFHSGKHIWSTALSCLRKTSDIVATGGADGKISLYPTKKPKPNDYEAFCMWDLEDILKDFPLMAPAETSIQEDQPIIDATEEYKEQLMGDIKPPKKKKPKKVAKDAFNRYAFVSESVFLATTTFGRVLECELYGSPRWSEVPLPESGKMDLKSYAVVKGFPEVGLAFLAGANGKIYIRNGQSPIKELCSVSGKVADLFGVSCDGTQCFQLFATTLATNIVSAFSIVLSSPGGATLIRSYSYTLPDKFVVTSASTDDAFLVLGSRSGSLAIYDYRVQEAPLCQWKDNLSSTGDAITAILPLSCPNSNQAVEKIHFVTTGRDGHYSIFSCTFAGTRDGKSPVLQLLHQGTPPFGPMIESAWFEGGDLILYGFKSKNFVVWNETKQYEILTVECGGAHRSYDYSSIKLVEGGGHFIYTKASKLYIHSQMNPSHKIVKQGGHGREIKTCAVSPELGIIATGAEDTAIRIWQYEDAGTTLEHHFTCQAVVQRHTAGIQHLQWFGTNYLFSSGGNEEFFVWAVAKIPSFGIGVVCEATCPDQSEERDLRIMSFDVSVAPGSAADEPKMLITLAYSDSTIRSYIYSKSEGFTLVATGTYTSACLTQINHIHISDRTIYTLTAATDGNLTLWKSIVEEPSSSPSQKLVFLSTKKIHQNAIKALDFRATKSGKRILVVTGGDDNALGISIYSMDDLSRPPIVHILRSAHAAAITGVGIMPQPDSVDSMQETFNVVSSGNDQRVKEWLVTVSSDEGKEIETAVDIKKIGDTFTSVADVGDVAVLRGGKVGGRDSEGKKVLLVGNGMEVWNVSR